ncbi:EFR1 family ferrodoxin [Crassaminicella profunda]|uniref:EFR1 family ferrodoxin n=1 Tax=Crassaminicella profunda TaxID=1286698 RepID=UPI001CA792DC|nr:EFR1 family ferrodoxin [Crassaminicella profunda]QZY53706.1 EFR1 family ferrodoxin [Crassaminicella profunda]
MNKKVNAMYFSATDTTKKVVSQIAKKISENMDGEITVNNIDFTLPEGRKESRSFTKEDIVVVGVPVYAGRVPNVLLKYLNIITGNGALVVPIVLYGNRNYDDALIELKDLLELNGFKIIAGGAFIGEHSFSKILANNRPDEKDLAIASDFADQIYKKIIMQDDIQNVMVKGNKPYRKYYKPKNKEGIPVDIRKVKPKTNSNCIDCKLCVSVCPMGSIDESDVSKFNGICIKCGACIKKCPTQAKYYDDQDYLRHKYELEIDYSERREPEIFI